MYWHLRQYGWVLQQLTRIKTMYFKIKVKLEDDTEVESLIEADNNQLAEDLVKSLYPNYKTIKMSTTYAPVDQ
jgi:hypothetical protein